MVCELGEGRIKNCNVTEEGIIGRGAKVSRNNNWFPIHVAEYLQANRGEGFCYAVLIDSDTLFVRPLGPFLPPFEPGARRTVDWDVAFTVYDPAFSAPWAKESSEVGRTQN